MENTNGLQRLIVASNNKNKLREFDAILGHLYQVVSMRDAGIDADIEEKEAELELLSGMIRNCVMMNASAALTEQEYQAQYTELSQRYESTKAGYEALLDRRKQMEATAIIFSGILFRLAELPQIPMEFNETLWHTLVDHVTVFNDERIVFTFTDGTEIVTML